MMGGYPTSTVTPFLRASLTPLEAGLERRFLRFLRASIASQCFGQELIACRERSKPLQNPRPAESLRNQRAVRVQAANRRG